MRYRKMICTVCFLCSIGWSPAIPARSSGIQGRWRYEDIKLGQLQIAFNADFSYYVDFQGDGKADIEGIYEFWDQRVIFSDESPGAATDCVSPGIYLFVIDGGRLTFQHYSDDCRPRQAVLRQNFVRADIIRGL